MTIFTMDWGSITKDSMIKPSSCFWKSRTYCKAAWKKEWLLSENTKIFASTLEIATIEPKIMIKLLGTSVDSLKENNSNSKDKNTTI